MCSSHKQQHKLKSGAALPAHLSKVSAKMPDSDSSDPGCIGDVYCWKRLPLFQSYALQHVHVPLKARRCATLRPVGKAGMHTMVCLTAGPIWEFHGLHLQ